MKEVFRQEREFLLTYLEFKKCLKLFDSVLIQDLHNVNRRRVYN